VLTTLYFITGHCKQSKQTGTLPKADFEESLADVLLDGCYCLSQLLGYRLTP